ncbi:IPTL-CTERM sorting domain-containing protein [Candidatus Zixiibacteriota bacterium]
MMFWHRGRGKRLLVAMVLSLTVIFLITATVAQAWPWRTASIKFWVKNRTGYTCNRIIGGGLSLLKVSRCIKGGSPYFPSCWSAGQYIGMYGLGYLQGFYFGDRTTGNGVWRKIGFKRKFCVSIIGAGVWLQDGWRPRGWFPLFGIKCRSPISIKVDDSLPQPFRIAGVEYALGEDPEPIDTLEWDADLPWEATPLVDEWLYPGDSILIPGIPDEQEIGDRLVVLRGKLIADITTDDTSYVDTVLFSAQIYNDESPIPTLNEWGMILMFILMAAAIVWFMVRQRRRMATA